MLAEVEAKKVGKTLGDVGAQGTGRSQVVAKTIADTPTCVEVEAPVKTVADTVAGVEAYTVVDTEQN